LRGSLVLKCRLIMRGKIKRFLRRPQAKRGQKQISMVWNICRILMIDWYANDLLLNTQKKKDKQREIHTFIYFIVWYIGIFSLVLESYREILIVLIILWRYFIVMGYNLYFWFGLHLWFYSKCAEPSSDCLVLSGIRRKHLRDRAPAYTCFLCHLCICSLLNQLSF